jgi:hypothetical protein
MIHSDDSSGYDALFDMLQKKSPVQPRRSPICGALIDQL